MNTQCISEFEKKDDYSIFLIGDSVSQTYDDSIYPLQGWGHFLPEKFDSHVTIRNFSVSGWGTSQYLEQWKADEIYNHKLWRNVLPLINKGDYVFVSVGVNDSAKEGYGTTKEKYMENLKKILSDARKKGAEVVFITPTIETGPEGGNSFSASWDERGKCMRQVAKECNAFCVDLEGYSVKLYNRLMREYNKEANLSPDDSYGYNKVCYRFNIYLTNLMQPKSEGGFGYTDETIKDCGTTHVTNGEKNYDGTHLNCKAAKEVSDIICSILKKSNLPLADNLV